jgi:hypothetical protein
VAAVVAIHHQQLQVEPALLGKGITEAKGNSPAQAVAAVAVPAQLALTLPAIPQPAAMAVLAQHHLFLVAA